MKLSVALFVFIGATAVSWSQTTNAPVPPNPASNVTAQVTVTNQTDAAILQQLSEKVQRLESKATQQDNTQADQLKAQLFEAETKVDRVRDAEAASRSTLYTVLYVVVALAAISIIGLVAFCFYTLRRLTQLGEPIFDNLQHRHPALPYGVPMGALPPQTGLPETPAATALTTLGENRLLDAVDRLERKIQDIESISHHENNHVSTTAARDPMTDPARNHHHADRFVLLLNKGEAHTNLQQFDKAIECFDQAIALAPVDPSPLVKKGYALEKSGKLEEAVRCYDQAVQLDPSYSMAYLFKGGVCNRLQKYAEAIDCYDRALAVRGNDTSDQ